MNRPNLHVSTNSYVTKVLFIWCWIFENNIFSPYTQTQIIKLTWCDTWFQILIEKGNAVGIWLVKDNVKYTVKARKEVILSAGAVNSPQILMLSGIGPKEHLSSLKVGLMLMKTYFIMKYVFKIKKIKMQTLKTNQNKPKKWKKYYKVKI